MGYDLLGLHHTPYRIKCVDTKCALMECLGLVGSWIIGWTIWNMWLMFSKLNINESNQRSTDKDCHKWYYILRHTDTKKLYFDLRIMLSAYYSGNISMSTLKRCTITQKNIACVVLIVDTVKVKRKFEFLIFHIWSLHWQ